MKVLILNQYVPPDASPTAFLVGEISGLLRAQGHEPVWLGRSTDYGVQRRGWARLAYDAGSWMWILVSGLAAPRAGAVVVMTSPPCLLLAGALVALRHRARLVHWVMDLYPETAEVLGECGPLLGSWISRAMGRAYAACDLVIALDADMAGLLEKKYRIKPEVLAPWGPFLEIPAGSVKKERERRVWMYSGNLGRAHDWKTLLDAQEKLEQAGEPWELVVQGGGAGYTAAREEAGRRNLRHCRWLPYAEKERLVQSLLEADVLVATRRPELCGLLWPSKLALLQALPRPLVWVGETGGAVAELLAARGGSVAFGQGDAAGLAAWLSDFQPPGTTPEVVPLETVRRRSHERWSDLVSNALK